MRETPRNNLPRQCASANALALVKRSRFNGSRSKRVRGKSDQRQGPFLPPETWYEPGTEVSPGYRIVKEPAGTGFVHVVDEEDVRRRLSEMPAWMLHDLENVQLSRMTRKKRFFPCYGMQWGSSLYLYPIEESLTECYDRPPKAAVYNEARMYGGEWEHGSGNVWRLHWTWEAIRDFYLNNILIHELGHLLDQRNRSAVDRERFAEWFAIEHGYRPTQRARIARLAAQRTLQRRHHRT